MGKSSKVLMGVFFAVVALVSMRAWAQQLPEELYKETEAACVASASTKATAQMIVDKVNDACALLEKEGQAAFPKFLGKDSPFIFAGTYISIHDLEGFVLLHPVKAKMNGQHLMDLKDADGKLIYVAEDKIAKEKGAGWVDYMWPKPGEKTASHKVTYAKLCRMDGKEVVLACGANDMSEAEINELVK
ncbi:MAG: cache domain-containing protein [Syntrophobacteraceae bacterium]|jgi:signal transduction histidine kinase